MHETEKCPICGSVKVKKQFIMENEMTMYECANCGKFLITNCFVGLIWSNRQSIYDLKKLSDYLFYEKDKNMIRPSFIGSKENYDSYKIYEKDSVAFLVTPEMVDTWYPVSFEERINRIILKCSEISGFVGNTIKFNNDETDSAFFLNNCYKRNNGDISQWGNELSFIIDYLNTSGFINYCPLQKDIHDFKCDLGINNDISFILTAKSWNLIYEMQKNDSENKQVFVAMQFGAQTENMRGKIKEGIEKAGYTTCIIDEKEYNGQIVPEILKQIRLSKFMVADFSDNNNGVYYEAGYAYGLGKQVIHICNEKQVDSRNNNEIQKLHFDIKQVNTITYTSIDDIPQMLAKRIEATIK